jgi:protein disulfide-isomerase A6
MKGKVKFAKVDATENQNLAQRFGVQGYPTIKYFDYGTAKSDRDAQTYQGARDAAGLKGLANDLLERADIAPEVHELFKQNVYD